MRRKRTLTEKEERGIINEMTVEETEDSMRRIVRVDIESDGIMQKWRGIC